MPDKISVLCVGGPEDGQKVSIFKGQNWYRTVVKKPTPEKICAGNDPATAEMEFFDYDLAEFGSTDEGCVRIFKPKGASLFEVMRMLTSGYRGNSSLVLVKG